MSPLANTRVVIIGGTSGIGFGVARAALAEAASVIIASSSGAKVAAALQRLGGGARASGEALDVNDEAAVKAFFEKTGKFDHLVFTAGGAMQGGFPGVELASVKNALLDARLLGALACVQHSRPCVSQSITLTSGTLAHRSIAGWAVGAALAGSVVAAARNLAVDRAPVRVNCIVPGMVDTEMRAGMTDEAKQALFEQVEKKIPVQHVGTPEEVADAYLFAMKCAYFTGQSLIVDGGSSLV